MEQRGGPNLNNRGGSHHFRAGAFRLSSGPLGVAPRGPWPGRPRQEGSVQFTAVLKMAFSATDARSVDFDLDKKEEEGLVQLILIFPNVSAAKEIRRVELQPGKKALFALGGKAVQSKRMIRPQTHDTAAILKLNSDKTITADEEEEMWKTLPR
ncbi:hypothetical protein NDU88_002323 [Pleurodeles waltl]|uniref:Uncharacterized protein n=1 Tax=Pleurodeles waltl TaxID=8319 RepID=A0AAV7LC82_PLEWA|nr:hypothetical protein NDU88_002323 [Pleurodeles waltl]